MMMKVSVSTTEDKKKRRELHLSKKAGSDKCGIRITPSDAKNINKIL